MERMFIGRPEVISEEDGVVTARIAVVSVGRVCGRPEVEMEVTVRGPTGANLRDVVLCYLDPE
ncbi:hypothetical protein [Lentisalinibacter orientalis]|uniref:hypothetical protein n=1 Tax=Lentisalinibacter orientalis TaxID=2992241 RepID=UPI003864A1A2